MARIATPMRELYLRYLYGTSGHTKEIVIKVPDFDGILIVDDGDDGDTYGKGPYLELARFSGDGVIKTFGPVYETEKAVAQAAEAHCGLHEAASAVEEARQALAEAEAELERLVGGGLFVIQHDNDDEEAAQ
jgi:hypothetical protein